MIRLFVVFLVVILLSFSCVSQNRPPSEPTDPHPQNGAEDVPIDVILSWDATDPDGDPLTYDVYFGTQENPPLVVEGLTEKSYDPGDLNHSTTYYWRVIAKDDHGNETPGPIWSFTTRAPPETTIFQDDFESYDVGSIPTRWDRYWYRDNGYAQVVEEGNPSKALKIVDPDEDSAVEVEEEFDPLSSGYLEFDFKIEDSFGRFGVKLESFGSFDLEVSYSQDDGKIYLMAERGGNLEKLIEIQKGIWYSVKVVFDLDESERIDIYVNGSYVGYGEFYEEDFESLKILTFINSSCQESYIDNVKLVSSE